MVTMARRNLDVHTSRYVQLTTGVVKIGALAGSGIMHSHAPDCFSGSSCLACFGWADDPRHIAHQAVPVGGVR